MQLIKDISYSKSQCERCLLDLYLPEKKEFPVLIYFHGGGLEEGSKEEEAIIVNLVQDNIALVRVNYRLYPAATYPEFIRDAAEAVAWVKENINCYGQCNQFFIGGSSAGAYLSMMLCFDRHYLQEFGIDARDFSGYIFDAGQPTTHFQVLRERGLDTRRIIVDEAAPLFHISGYDGMPPMLILVAEHDLENRYEQTKLMLSTLKHFDYPATGVEFRFMEGFEHCAYIGQPVFNEILSDFIRRRCVI